MHTYQHSTSKIHISCHCDIKTGEVIFSEVNPAADLPDNVTTNVKALELAMLACCLCVDRYKEYKNDQAMQSQIKKNVPPIIKKLKHLYTYVKSNSFDDINSQKRISHRAFHRLRRSNKNLI